MITNDAMSVRCFKAISAAAKSYVDVGKTGADT